jgi:hypothetical protein
VLQVQVVDCLQILGARTEITSIVFVAPSLNTLFCLLSSVGICQ